MVLFSLKLPLITVLMVAFALTVDLLALFLSNFVTTRIYQGNSLLSDAVLYGTFEDCSVLEENQYVSCLFLDEITSHFIAGSDERMIINGLYLMNA